MLESFPQRLLEALCVCFCAAAMLWGSWPGFFHFIESNTLIFLWNILGCKSHLSNICLKFVYKDMMNVCFFLYFTISEIINCSVTSSSGDK